MLTKKTEPVDSSQLSVPSSESTQIGVICGSFPVLRSRRSRASRLKSSSRWSVAGSESVSIRVNPCLGQFPVDSSQFPVLGFPCVPRRGPLPPQGQVCLRLHSPWPRCPTRLGFHRPFGPSNLDGRKIFAPTAYGPRLMRFGDDIPAAYGLPKEFLHEFRFLHNIQAARNVLLWMSGRRPQPRRSETTNPPE